MGGCREEWVTVNRAYQEKRKVWVKVKQELDTFGLMVTDINHLVGKMIALGFEASQSREVLNSCEEVVRRGRKMVVMEVYSRRSSGEVDREAGNMIASWNEQSLALITNDKRMKNNVTLFELFSISESKRWNWKMNPTSTPPHLLHPRKLMGVVTFQVK